MIGVEVFCNGRSDFAEADDPESARDAARVLFDEAYAANWGAFQPTTTFRVDGAIAFVCPDGRRP
jgi:hypothetical protein